MPDIFVRAIPVVEAGTKGVHLAWLGPSHVLYSPTGWTIERRESAGPEQIPSLCENVTTAQIKRGKPLNLRFGPLSFSPGTFPAGGPCTVCTLELDPVNTGIHGNIQGGIAFIAAFRGGKAVTGLGPVIGAFDLGPLPVDRLVIYLRSISGDTVLRICRYQYNKDDWTHSKLLVRRQLPLRELMPGLTDEFAEAKDRLLPGESIDPDRFRNFADLLRGVSASHRGVVLARMKDDDDFDELGQLDPLRMVYSSPLWRRALGFGYFDNDPELVAGQAYDYRISTTFPSGDRIYGFHTIPSGTPLPAEFFLHDCRFRLPSPTVVELSPNVPQVGNVVHTQRGIFLRPPSTLPWIADFLEDFSLVIDLPAPASLIALELDPGHQLEMRAGMSWGSDFSAPIPIPAGSKPVITLSQPANQLRITGKGFLSSLIIEPGEPQSAVVVISPVTLINTPLPAPPVSATARSLQAGNAIAPVNQVRPRLPLGMKVNWEPASMLNNWSIPGSPPPLDATAFQIERFVEPNGPWTPVLGDDNLALGTREEATRSSAVHVGADLMEFFPETPGPQGTSTQFSFDDLFLEGQDGQAKPKPPKPSTMLRYRLATIDAFGRRSATLTETTSARLEKHEPPPTPASAAQLTTDQLSSAAPTGVTASVLIRGADLSPEEIAILGSSNNAIVLRWGWRSTERDQDPFARHFRVYLASPLDEVACQITSVTPVASRPGEYQVNGTCDRAVTVDASKGQYLDAGYPFFIDTHTGGTNIQLRVRSVVVAPGGDFRVPKLAAAKLLIPYSSNLTRPRGWRERLMPVIPITSAEQYEFVLRDRLQLTDEHPRDELWIGVSCADDQPYVPDTFPVAPPLDGNESSVAGIYCQGRKYLQPEFTIPPPTGPVARLYAPEPTGPSIKFQLDLTSFLGGSGLTDSSLVFPERLHDGDLLRAYEIRNNLLIAVSNGSAQAVDIPNPDDANTIIQVLQQGNYEDLDDRFLVLLASLNPFRDHLFRATGERPIVNLAFEESLPSAAARYVYRFRRANIAGQLSADGVIPSAVVRVPSTSTGATPHKEASFAGDPTHSFRLRIPNTTGLSHVLVFRAPVSDATAHLIRVPNRPDLHPSGHLRLAIGDDTALEPETIAVGLLAQDTNGRSTTVGPGTLQGSVQIWAATVTSDGMPSELAGPWTIHGPWPLPVMPVLSGIRSGGLVHLSWNWNSAEKPALVVEQSVDGNTWRRVSAPISSTVNSLEIPQSDAIRYRLRAGIAFSNILEI